MEFVFVVPREKLFPDAYPYGFLPFGKDSLESAMTDRIEEFGFYVERARAEHAPEWKQVIPYTIVVRDGQVLCLARTKQGGEKRLHDKLSIGVGGHINPIDLSEPEHGSGSRNPIARATQREVLEEELCIEGTHSLRSLGLLNDDSNPVGAVHVGWVQAMTVQGTVQVREVDQLEGRFYSVSELQNMLAEGANFETWSSFLIPKLDRLLDTPFIRAAPSRTTTAPIS